MQWKNFRCWCMCWASFFRIKKRGHDVFAIDISKGAISYLKENSINAKKALF